MTMVQNSKLGGPHTKWVTAEGGKVDRIACPWLIRNFVDRDAEFLFVPLEQVLEVAKREGAIPFDIPGVELGHFVTDGNEYVSFDAIIKKYGLKDKALLELAKIVRGADARLAGVTDSAPEAIGLEAAATGFRAIAANDYENMRLQFPLYDALYKYCQWRVEEGVELEHYVR
jgi:hypothetical protein